jgi:hypothetical protein
MLFVREFIVRKHERGLLFKNGDFVRFLAPAVYRFFDPRGRVDVERFDLGQPAFEHRLADFLLRWYPDEMNALFLRVETGAQQIAVIHRNGHPWTVVGPCRRALYWKGVVQLRADFVDVEPELAVAPVMRRALIDAAVGLRLKELDALAKLKDDTGSVAMLAGLDGALTRFAHVRL